MKKNNVLTGPRAAREYVHFFRDPIRCMRELQQKYGSLVALGPIAFGEPTKLHVLAIGPGSNCEDMQLCRLAKRNWPESSRAPVLLSAARACTRSDRGKSERIHAPRARR